MTHLTTRTSNKLGSMRGRDDQLGLRLAAKAADREKAARQEWPTFEKRLRELGYGPRAIAHAFSTLSGPGTVAEALEVLKGMSRPESRPVALSFEVSETRRGPAAAHGVAITSVERGDLGIRVNYDIVPPLGFGSHGPQPRGEATDDLGNRYHSLGSHFGLARDESRGGLTMPLPPPAATMLRILITWGPALSSTREGLAHEVRVSLPR
jgi:hypothetical protein